MTKAIWVELFKDRQKHYCYDVTTNHIMRIDQVLFNVLKIYNYSNSDEVIDRLKIIHPLTDIFKAIESIDIFSKNQGGFALKRNINLRFPFSKSQYNKALQRMVNHLVLNLTENCNYRCRYCKYTGSYSSDQLHGQKSMSWDIARKSIDFLVSNASYILENTDKELVVGFYGGEPLLEKGMIRKTIAYISKEYKPLLPRFRFSMTTNASLLDEEMIRLLNQHAFTLLISLDGPEMINDRYRIHIDGKGTYDTVIKKIDLIRKISPQFFEHKVGFSIVISPGFQLKDVIDYFRTTFDGNNRVFLFSMVDDKGTNFFDTFDMRREWRYLRKDQHRLKKVYKKLKTSGQEDVILNALFDNDIAAIHKRQLRPLQGDVFPNGICFPGLQKLFVDTDGNFHFCERINWRFSIGNVNQGFDVEKIYSYIDQYISSTGNCKYCWALRFCKECFLSSIKDDQFSRDQKKTHCFRNRKRILKNLKDYVEMMEINRGVFDHTNPEKTFDLFQHLFQCINTD